MGVARRVVGRARPVTGFATSRSSVKTAIPVTRASKHEAWALLLPPCVYYVARTRVSVKCTNRAAFRRLSSIRVEWRRRVVTSTRPVFYRSARRPLRTLPFAPDMTSSTCTRQRIPAVFVCFTTRAHTHARTCCVTANSVVLIRFYFIGQVTRSIFKRIYSNVIFFLYF